MHAALCAKLRRQPHLTVRHLRADDLARPDLLPTYLQSGQDVHGSHGLFYWLRARGDGALVTQDDGAAVALSWRGDVARLVALRPVGRADAVVALLQTADEHAPPGASLVVRYCTNQVASRLRALGWTGLRQPWTPQAPVDDETFPEVIVLAPIVDVPAGQRYKPIREAIYRHHRTHTYQATPVPLNIGEDRFIQRDAARAAEYDEHEAGFNAAVLSSLAGTRHDWLTYHYLFAARRLAGFAITADITGISHGYYLSTLQVPRLATYFLWHIYQQQRRAGACALNLGGSEARDLHNYKMRTFPDHVLQYTSVLQAPAPPHRR